MWHISPKCVLAAWHWAPGKGSVSMGGGIHPESPKVATRRRAESRRARSAVQRETTEWKFLIHLPRLSAPVQLRSSPPLRRTELGLGRPSIPRARPSPPLRVTTSIIFCDQAFDLRANGSGRIQSARPSMDMAGQNRKVLQVTDLPKSVNGWDYLGIVQILLVIIMFKLVLVVSLRACSGPLVVLLVGFWLLQHKLQHHPVKR